MKRDLDRLMAERNLDAIMIDGPDGLEAANSDYSYFVGNRHLPGIIIKKRGEPITLLHSPWEQIDADATGLALVSLDRWNRRDIIKEFPDPLAAAVEMRRRILVDLRVTGRVGVYGVVRAGWYLALIDGLRAKLPTVTFVAEIEQNILVAARRTKDEDEVDEMRRIGRLTCEVVQAVVDFIGSGRAHEGALVDAQGQPITIGHVKQLIARELAGRDLEAASTIFAQGRDAGLPHARGEATQPLLLGTALVFDIFPRTAGGGYYHDMTRTFAIGHAPPALQTAYDQVLGAFTTVMDELEMGAPTRAYQDLVCTYFEERGHDTIGKTYPIEEGYIHSLGHGLGLDVHEEYSFSSLRDTGDMLQPGAVFTVEPGLYYPDRGFGVRIEDTVYCAPDGTFESLTPFPKELVIPIAAA